MQFGMCTCFRLMCVDSTLATFNNEATTSPFYMCTDDVYAEPSLRPIARYCV